MNKFGNRINLAIIAALASVGLGAAFKLVEEIKSGNLHIILEEKGLHIKHHSKNGTIDKIIPIQIEPTKIESLKEKLDDYRDHLI